jgi:hypothetical protein
LERWQVAKWKMIHLVRWFSYEQWWFTYRNCDLMGFTHYKWWFDGDLPSGKHTKNYGKSPCD